MIITGSLEMFSRWKGLFGCKRFQHLLIQELGKQDHPSKQHCLFCLLFGILGCIVFLNLFLVSACQLLLCSLRYFVIIYHLSRNITQHRRTQVPTSRAHHLTVCNHFPRSQCNHCCLIDEACLPIFCWDFNKP